MLDLLPFLCGACGCPYNYLVICKDSSDCLSLWYISAVHVHVCCDIVYHIIVIVGHHVACCKISWTAIITSS